VPPKITDIWWNDNYIDEKAFIQQKKLLNLPESVELIPIEDLSDLRQ